MPTPPPASSPQTAQIDELYTQGLALHRQGQVARAQQIYERIVALQPRHLQALSLLGVAGLQTGRFAAAVAWLERAIEVDPADPSLHSNKGLAEHELGRVDDALASYDRALALAPDDASFHFNRANTLRAADQLEAAVAGYDRSIGLNPQFAQAHCNRGSALMDLGQPDGALDSFERAIALMPTNADLHGNRGNALQDLHRFDEALASYDRAIGLDPAHADVRWNQALVQLLTGDLTAGWRAYEWRRRHPKMQATMQHFAQPAWLGEAPLDGKRILLHAEQGYGDVLQFCRYARLVADRGARVVLSAPRAMIGLLGSLEGVDELIAAGDPLPAFDCQCPLMSLPLAFGTTLDTIPSPGAYLRADPPAIDRWAARLGPKSRPRVGLVWSGNPGSKIDASRSIPLARVVAHLPQGPDYISLQKDVRPADRQALTADGRILDLSAEILDFADTAALCALMDLVIAVDTAVAHLAGALGRPTWLMLRHASDWRWLLQREDSPWYGSVRIFRQGADGDWDRVLQRVAAELGKLS